MLKLATVTVLIVCSDILTSLAYIVIQTRQGWIQGVWDAQAPTPPLPPPQIDPEEWNRPYEAKVPSNLHTVWQ